jgi:serine/threonine protein kinase
MSPEQAQGLPDLDGRSDVWSLAATLYEALCGHPPHGTGGSAFAVMNRIVQEDAPRLSCAAPSVPMALCDVIHAGLARDRNRRTHDAVSFARELARAVPEARWSLSGMHAAYVQPDGPVLSALGDAGPPTVPAPPPAVGDLEVADRPEEPPPSSAGSPVQFFRRDTGGLPVPAKRPGTPLTPRA